MSQQYIIRENFFKLLTNSLLKNKRERNKTNIPLTDFLNL